MITKLQSRHTRVTAFGVDAPAVPMMLGAAALACAVVTIVLAVMGNAPAAAIVGAYAAYFTVSVGLYLHTSLRGKFIAWEHLLDRLAIRGDETAVDLGCGRGAVLLAIAQRLPAGEAIGVDLWRTKDQSGNAGSTTLGNAAAFDVADRVKLLTADITKLPLDDDSVDIVVSSLAIHNISSEQGRAAAVLEAARVLRPSGQLAVLDFRHVARYARVLTDAGLADVEVERLGWRTWFGGPWFGCSVVQATKPAHRSDAWSG